MGRTGSQNIVEKTKGKKIEDAPEDFAKVASLKNELKKEKEDNAEIQEESRMNMSSLANKIHEVQG